MKKPCTLSSALATFFVAALSLTLAGCDARRHQTPAIAPAPIYTTDETATFETLTKETLKELAAGKNTEMIAKLTDLETAWDDHEAVLKPRDPATWTLLDKTLDKGISALRSSRPDPEKGKASLEDLLKKLQEATKR